MNRPFIEQLRIQNYGCIQDATFELTPLHALIGPNDSGKSTALRALRTLSVLVTEGDHSEEAKRLLRVIRASKAADGPRFELSSASSSLRAEFSLGAQVEWMSAEGNELSKGTERVFGLVNVNALSVYTVHEIAQALNGAQLLRLDPDALRQPHSLIPDDQPLRFEDEHGTGLPALYDAILARDLPAYQAITAELTRLFPDVASIRLTTPDPHTKGMGVKLIHGDGTFVPAELMSEGLLYYLAFAALPHIDPTALLLVEEPENGLHPSRIAEVVRVLRAISQTTQVVIATHSPLVINELQPEEVTVVTRSRDKGTKATPMTKTADFAERSKVYALGELWLSYANGEDESALLDGGPRP